MEDDDLRTHLVAMLRGGDAHGALESSLREFPAEFANSKVDLIKHTPWQLLEHMRIAQWDILEFSRNPGHASPEFPKGYWPESDTASEDEWEESVDWFFGDFEEMIDLVSNPTTDLFAQLPHGTGQTVLREANVIATHNAYHLGQLFVIRRALEELRTI